MNKFAIFIVVFAVFTAHAQPIKRATKSGDLLQWPAQQQEDSDFIYILPKEIYFKNKIELEFYMKSNDMKKRLQFGLYEATEEGQSQNKPILQMILDFSSKETELNFDDMAPDVTKKALEIEVEDTKPQLVIFYIKENGFWVTMAGVHVHEFSTDNAEDWESNLRDVRFIKISGISKMKRIGFTYS